MNPRFQRTELLVGKEGVERLRKAAVAVIGVGGVGAYAAEALARAGVGRLLLVDADIVDLSNINRQLYALDSTIGRKKVDVARERVFQINPEACVDALDWFVDEDNVASLPLQSDWHVIDAVDTVRAKAAILAHLHARGMSCVACMGAAQRRDPSRVQTADLSATHGCPLARLVRQALRRVGVESGILCVFSDEPPIRPGASSCSPKEDRPVLGAKPPVGSISYMPALFGLTAASAVINRILNQSPTDD